MAGSSVYELKLAELQNHLRTLKRVQSRETRTQMKGAYLPDYQDYVAGVLAGGQGAQDQVLMQVMIWWLDVGEMADFMQIAEYALEHGLTLPERFSRTLACFVVEETSEYVNEKLTDADAEQGLALLNQVAELTAEADMPDEVRAKQAKAFGYMTFDDPQVAITHFDRALQLDPKIAHVKKPLQQLNKAAELAASTASGAD